MSTARKKQDLEALSKLIKSRGWAVLREVMEKEILQSALSMAENRPMSIDQINFNRGALWAANQLINLPDKMHQILLNDILIEESTAKKDDAPLAGK